MKLLGFDLETPQAEAAYGLQPWRARTGLATIKTAAVCSEDRAFKLKKRMPSKQDFEKLLTIAIRQDYTFAVWNGVFDAAWLCALDLYPLLKKCKWIDGMLLLKRINAWRGEPGERGFSLKNAVADFFPSEDGYKLTEEQVTKVPETEEEWRILLDYNLKDAEMTALLCRLFWKMLSPDERRGAIIEAQGIPDVALSWVNGIYINDAALDPFEADVDQTVLENEPIFGAPMSTVRSPKKLGQLLYEDWGYPPIKLSPKGAPATDKESLMKLAIQHPEDPRFNALMKLRKCNTQKSKFITAVRKSIEYHGESVTRPSPAIAGTMTGRFTYGSFQGKNKGRLQTGIALHQWERGKVARNLLCAPAGYLLAEFDFSGQEMRLMAIESEDDTMLRLFADGEDLHAYMGADIEGLDYQYVREMAETNDRAKNARYLGKFANLSSQYRIGIDTMMVRALTGYGLQLWKQKAQHIKTTYLRTYPGVPRYWKSAVDLAVRQGYASTRGHRHLPLHNLNEYSQQQNAINHPIQGTGADMKALGIYVCSKYFNADIMYAWDLHDALFLYVRDDEQAVSRVKFLQGLLSNLPYKKAWGWEPSIPLPVDAKLGKTWGTLKGV